MQVYTTNKTSGSIYILKKHPQHSNPIKWCSVFGFKWNSIPFSKKGIWLIFRWIPPRLTSEAFRPQSFSASHSSTGGQGHPSDRWFEGGLVDGKGWDGRWCFSRICRCLVVYLGYVCWKKCASWCGRKSATLVIIVTATELPGQLGFRGLSSSLPTKKNAAVFVQGAK